MPGLHPKPRRQLSGHYLSGKIRQLTSLSEKKQEAYITLHSRLIRQVLIPAYQALIQGLEELKGTGKQSGGLCSLPGGREYYEYLLKSNCGLYDSVPAIQQRLLAQLQADVVESSQLLGENSSLAQQIASETETWTGSSDPEEISGNAAENDFRDFPEAPAVSWEVKYVHPDLEEYLSPAFYLTPPVDTLSPNAIYNQRPCADGRQPAVSPHWPTRAFPVICIRLSFLPPQIRRKYAICWE